MKRLIFACLASACMLSVSCTQQPSSPILTVEGGQIEGVVSADVPGLTIYKGIPFAAAPVGDFRWKKPQPVEPWEGVRKCDEFGPASLQKGSAPAPGSFYWREFYSDGEPEYSEDCLYLNVWTPAAGTDAKLPVMMWIHGGAFNHGYGYEIEFDGEEYAKKGVILVTINYRVGMLGLLAHPLLTEENDGLGSGNYGLFDQLAALYWIKNNIAAFGGDPDNVTIFGQSAGAGSVQSLISSPLAEGYVQRAILQSGGGLNGAGFSRTLADAEEAGKALWEGAGFTTLEEMRAYPADKFDELRSMSHSHGNQPRRRGPAISTCIDGELLVASNYDRAINGNELDISYMIGSTSEDLNPESMRDAAVNWSLLLEEQGRKPAYVYCFTRDLPGEEMPVDPETGVSDELEGAFHSSELWYMFGTLGRCWRPMEDADYELSERMVTYWTNFAKTGNPNGEGVPEWKPCVKDDQYVQILDVE